MRVRLREVVVLVALLLLLLLPLWSSCARGKPGPVELVIGEESCAECRMAVSQRRFASEVVRRGAEVEAFDDLGCLVRRVRAQPLPAEAAAYVADFGTGAWVDASAAFFVQSAALPTPMSSGLIAFSAHADADRAAAKYGGRVLEWREALAEPSSTPATAGRDPESPRGTRPNPSAAVAEQPAESPEEGCPHQGRSGMEPEPAGASR